MSRRFFHPALLRRKRLSPSSCENKFARWPWRRPQTLWILLFLLLLIGQAPPTLWLPLLRPHLPDLTITHPSGTFWNGQVETMVLRGQTLRNVRWSLPPTSLLTLTPHISFSFGESNRAPRGEGTMEMNLWNSHVRIHLPKAQLPLMLLTSGLNLPEAFVLDAETHMQSLELSIKHMTLEQVRGEIKLIDVHLEQDPEKRFGHFLVRLTTDDQGLHADIKDQGGPVQLSMQWDRENNGVHSLRGSVKNTAPNLQRPINLLKYIGRTDTDGAIHLQWSGIPR